MKKEIYKRDDFSIITESVIPISFGIGFSMNNNLKKETYLKELDYWLNKQVKDWKNGFLIRNELFLNKLD